VGRRRRRDVTAPALSIALPEPPRRRVHTCPSKLQPL
jgi:hypothetical protein